MDLKTSYNVLGIDPQADESSAKHAYKAQVRRWHPDQFPEGTRLKATAEEQLKQINIAYTHIKADLAHRRHEPIGTPATESTQQSRNEPPQNDAPRRKRSERSWFDHLFDTLNAFAGVQPDDSSTTSGDQTHAKRRPTFRQVLDETAGGKPISSRKPSAPAGQHTRYSYAEVYKRYRRQGTTVGEVDAMQSKGPVEPVGRVRGIGRSR